ncbi:bucky ball [Nematolebias whitei]|uniref:bucky ball n=1 Tax=Nematolebias whitei TaxID=451745 RepID=UPI001897A5AB|nr:bucky ball [Nematolebias whitei]
MDDASQQPHFGNGEQRGHHPRPFFYVQPPQPYYLYPQWQLGSPYSHFGLPAGFNHSRPCMPPYPYMPYPGFVLPHAPLYPVDYRRMFEPRFQHASAWGDAPRQQHHPQPHGRRETTCSGAQTDPSDAISKLIECLDKIRATDLQSADRELDSGIASQSAGLSPREEKKMEEEGRSLSTPRDCLGSPAATFMDSTAAVYDSESSQGMLDALSPQERWTGRLEEELPLDSSSLHEECSLSTHFVSLEKEVTDIQTNISVSDSSVLKCDAEEHLKATPSPKLSLQEANGSDKVSKLGDLGTSDEAKPDESCQILRLPFDSVLTPGSGCLSSPSASYYNYLMQTTHERMSVLSPSLDELSSRDEMFSTDLDDADLFPKHVHAGNRLADVDAGSPQAADDGPLKLWLPYTKKFACSCCGRSLTTGTSRSRVHSPKLYMDEAGESEEEGRYGRGCEQPVRVVGRKHSAPRRTRPVSPRHAAKPWRRSQYVQLSEPVKQEGQAEAAEAETEELDSSELQCRTCQDGLCREDVTTTDRGRWTDGDVIPRRRRGVPQQRQEMSTLWKPMYHRPQDDRDEETPHHWERGCTVKEPRC